MGKQEFTLQRSLDGYARPVFTPEVKALAKSTFNLENVEVYDEEEAQVKGALGHAIMMPFVFQTASWAKREEDGTKKTIDTDEMLIPIAIIEPSRAKEMEMTPVEGRDGTVKEYGSHGDYTLTIRGILISEDGKYPADLKATLQKIEEAKVAIGIACDILNDLGIDDVVVMKIKWIPGVGIENAQAFEMDCVQDTQLLLKLEGEV